MSGNLAILPPSWKGVKSDIWLCSSLRLDRNVDKYKFPSKMEGDRRRQVGEMLCKALMSAEGLQGPKCLDADSLSPIEKEFLSEYFLHLSGFQHAHASEGFVVDKEGCFLAVLGMNDHLKLQLVDFEGELEKTLSRLISLENSLAKSINFAFSPKFGYLTADPGRCGTGLKIQLYLQLPALIHSGKLEAVLDKDKGRHIRVQGLQGAEDSFVGDILVLSNRQTLGVNEEGTVGSLSRLATKLVVQEKAERKGIKETLDPHFMDLVSRAYGILNHSFQLETAEAFEYLSLLKLGVDLGWMKGVSVAKLNELLFSCRRGQMLHTHGETEMKHLAERRSEHVRKALKKLSLTL